MAKKGKVKISKVKRNNQTTTKLKKQGKLRLQRHRQKAPKMPQPQSNAVEYSSDSDSASGDEWADMLDEEEQKYIMSRIAEQPRLLAHVPENETTEKSRKRKREDKGKIIRSTTAGSDSGAESDESYVEQQYEQELAEKPRKKLRALLPIKTKDGLMERAEELEDSDKEDDHITEEVTNTTEVDEQESENESDSGVDGTEEGGAVSAVELLAARRDRLQHEKLRIGALCSSLLESPEKKLKNLYPILYLMEDRLKDNTLNLHSVRKLATLSVYEVFKDILPDYQIRHQDYSNVKLKKDTLALYKYEKELLEFYKRYLQRLEKATMVLRRKKGDTRKLPSSTLDLALVSLRCLCGMLEARPHFNYATNIAQSLVPLLGSPIPHVAETLTQCLANVFKDDKKGDITLAIVRLINQLVKRRGDRLAPSALDCLLSLNIKDVQLDAEADLRHKKKLEEKHKKRIINLSKKEKKRAKKLKEVERELLETEAQESEASRRKLLTEVTKTVFHIYFRLLKHAPRSKLLVAVLNGLAKFTHVINLEYYSDLLAILGRLLQDETVNRSSRLVCVRTVLHILARSGDAINVQPALFHEHLYSSAAQIHAGSSQEDVRIVLESIAQICACARRVSTEVLQAFAKRLATLATQLHHNGALACLVMLHQLAQHSKAVSSLLEPECERSGSGRYEPLQPSPTHCNAHAAAAHELHALRTHYHATVRDVAGALAHPHRTLPGDFNKLSPLQILEQYDGSQMSFKPTIPPPKPSNNTKLAPVHTWAQPSFKILCENVENSVKDADFTSLVVRVGR